jgi:predicted N-formylglutamate amidohydrolase
VVFTGAAAVIKSYEILGQPVFGGILVVGDHASNHVPEGIQLGLDAYLLQRHIAWDIGVQPVAALMVKETGFSAILGAVSRLVVDLNRYSHEDAVVPQSSDGIDILANSLSAFDRQARLDQYFHPYHNALSELIVKSRPSLLLSLHSFTPQLESKPEESRPWEIGVLYNEDDRAARIAIPNLRDAGLNVGDQLPYSGKLLNATMNRHGEGNNLAYLGIEIRQDLVSNIQGQAKFAALLADLCKNISETLGVVAQNE